MHETEQNDQAAAAPAPEAQKQPEDLAQQSTGQPPWGDSDGGMSESPATEVATGDAGKAGDAPLAQEDGNEAA